MFSQFPFILAQEAASLTILDRISPHDLLPIIVVTVSLVFGSIIAVSAIVLGNWRKVRERKIVASLIQDMLDRNMSSVEIEQVMSAWSNASGECSLPKDRPFVHSPQKPPKPAKFA